MSKLSLIEQSSGQYIVSGNLTFASINEQTPTALKFLSGVDQVCIDLAKVEATDSAGLALMIEWIKLSRAKQIQLRFKNIPVQLLTLAKLSGLENNEYFASQAV
jgi:phospholipid transport system transporter-binding protein